MIQIWARGPSSPALSAPRADTKLMSEPSGDQAGAVSPCSLKVSWRWPVPSLATRQTCVREFFLPASLPVASSQARTV